MAGYGGYMARPGQRDGLEQPYAGVRNLDAMGKRRWLVEEQDNVCGVCSDQEQ